MWTISAPTDLPFQAGDVGAHFGFPGGVTVRTLAVHSISAGGKFCAGTVAFTPTGTTVEEVRGFILINSQKSSAPEPFWTVVPNFQLPPAWTDYSIRGVNDNGDICGFFFHVSKPGQHPYIKRFRKKPVEIESSPGDLALGTVWDISNDLWFAGEYRKNAQEPVTAFMAKARPDGSMEYTEPMFDRIKSFNNTKDLLYVIDGIHFFELGKGSLAGQPVNLTDLAIYRGLRPVMMNGINESRYVAGFFGPQPPMNPPPPPPNRKGVLLQIGVQRRVSSEIFFHPEFPKDTRLFSISDKGIVVGVAGEVRPFFLIAQSGSPQSGFDRALPRSFM